MLNEWYVNFGSGSSTSSLRLICFPFAGGAPVNFQPWAQILSDRFEVIGVQTPGHGTRASEKPISDMNSMQEALMPALKSLISGGPYAVVGYSVGALIAFEWVHRLRAESLPMPKHFVALSRGSPQAPLNRQPITNLPDAEFLDALDRLYGGIPELVRKNQELLAIFLPGIRADLQIFENYKYQAQPKLEVPLTAISGKRDTNVREVDGWQEQTCGNFESRQFDGGHFFTQGQEVIVLEYLSNRIQRG